MARKKDEPRVIHPVALLESLTAYRNDANALLYAVRNAIGFMEDKELDAAKVLEVVTPTLKDAVKKLERWNEAD